MLKKVLSQPASRPRALLEALGSSHDFVPTDNGVVVSFQENTSPQKIVQHEQTPSSAALNTRQPLAETSPPKREPQKIVQNVQTSSPPAALNTPQPLAASAATKRSTKLKIECRPCGTQGAEGGARAFVMGPTPLSIVLCSNRLHSLGNPLNDSTELEEVLVHELVHVHDVKALKMDLRKCVNLAYSEIRAAREAECRDSWMQPYCVKQKALQATQNLFPQEAGNCISQAYEKAMQDMRPFQNVKDSSRSHSER